MRLCKSALLLLITLSIHDASLFAADFEKSVKPVLQKHCFKCHGGDEVNGMVDFKTTNTAKQFLASPKLIKEMIEALDANDMPPEGEPALSKLVREKLLSDLKSLLREAVSEQETKSVPIRRLNRFQYNNAVRDLFGLNRDVFSLSEKLMTRNSKYVTAKQMPKQVNVVSMTLKPPAGLQGVRAFPKDLRASHGFDNQANQLTLSPLLLDAFLRLSVSIVESPDFNEKTVGTWNSFFKEPPENVDRNQETKRRIGKFLRIAFRGSVDTETLDRYTAFATTKLEQGMPYTACIKKIASAALSSPMFLYRSSPAGPQFELASNLSFFLWASAPDDELLRLAEAGELSKPDVLNKTIDRMMSDAKIERFLDTFPAQWMQLENVLAATPDPQKHRFFSLDKQSPASLQMLIEPLLLFDTVFVEDRPIVELIQPDFSYQSDFLQTWYTSDLKPPKIDRKRIDEQNRSYEEQRKKLEQIISTAQTSLDAIEKPAKEKLLEARKKKIGEQKPVDLKPYAAWEFNGDLKASVSSLNLKPNGKIEFRDGMVVLNRAYLLSEKLPIDLRAKSLEVWFKAHNLDQRGGGVMGTQGPGDFFDTIVLGERKNRHWISGSNGFSRTLDFPESPPETLQNEMLHLVMVYNDDGSTLLYRNGVAYGKPFNKGRATFPKNRTSIIFGLRHLPAGGNRFLSCSIDNARLYNRALTAEEAKAAFSGKNLYISEEQLLAALSDEQKTERAGLKKQLKEKSEALAKVPKNIDLKVVQQNSRNQFDNQMRGKLRGRDFVRVPASDPRYGGVITNAAMLSMTSGPKRTHPIARGAWIIEVIFNDPPPPPPNDVPALNEEASSKDLTIREKFAVHRENPDCAGCHSRLDPLGFALENFDITGRWRDKYDNGRNVDSSGTLVRKYPFTGIVQFKNSLVKEKRRFAKAFTAHLLRFATSRELEPRDALVVDSIVSNAATAEFKLRSPIKAVVQSESFQPAQ
ncbi:MAG: hypothetical protein CMJ78_09305 [Planctomycetaceae bacterium]|nr:hypothetical protein [Planctomycetaceae bacterium]